MATMTAEAPIAAKALTADERKEVRAAFRSRSSVLSSCSEGAKVVSAREHSEHSD
jgi:hypothetical protein